MNDYLKAGIKNINSVDMPIYCLDGLSIKRGKDGTILWTPKKKSKKQTLMVTECIVNLKYPRKVLEDGFKKLIDAKKRKFGKKEKRTQIAMFDTYLTILDLYKKGMKIEDIAEKVYPQECKKNLYSAIRKVHRGLKQGINLLLSKNPYTLTN